ncbi:MAG: phosphatidylserine decarboxylase [Coraliomargaritaceae bacterium]
MDDSNPDAPIRVYNRASGEMETEVVYGEAFLRWAYGSLLGRLTLLLAIQRSVFSQFYGWLMNRSSSRSKIAPFIEKYEVEMDDFECPESGYAHFNAFFYRRLRPGARPVDGDRGVAVFPADGRHLGFSGVSAEDRFSIKGQPFDLAGLVGDAELARIFTGGSLLISRLCPVDYHRYHFPVDGKAGESVLLPGYLRSVSPLALRRRLSILWENRRERTLIDSPVFGRVLFLEIGATCVGRIEQTYAVGPVEKGDEKGFFAFGGSCVATLFEKGAIRFDPDLVDYSKRGIEMYARMGERCGIIER